MATWLLQWKRHCSPLIVLRMYRDSLAPVRAHHGSIPLRTSGARPITDGVGCEPLVRYRKRWTPRRRSMMSIWGPLAERYDVLPEEGPPRKLLALDGGGIRGIL